MLELVCLHEGKVLPKLYFSESVYGETEQQQSQTYSKFSQIYKFLKGETQLAIVTKSLQYFFQKGVKMWHLQNDRI